MLKFTGPLFFRIVAFFFFITIGAVTGSPEEKQASSRDAYVSSGTVDARKLLPLFADDATSASLCGYIYNGLTKIDKNLDIVPDLAKSWEIENNGLSIKFYLRENVTWHDAKPFTAEDVYFTYNTILKSETACPYISSYADISKIEVIDNYTIRFHYSKPYAPMLSKFGMGIIPKHVFEDAKDIKAREYAERPVGTGPYKFSRWESGEYMLFDANESYFEHVPGIKRYVYRIIPDQAVQFLELITGGIDEMELNPYQYLHRSDSEEFKNRINKYKYLAHSYTYVGYNLKDTLFKDKRVRQALSYAINKKEIIDAVLLGLGEECTGPFLKGTRFYDDSVKGYEYNPNKARQLLDQAGWRDSDGDGILDKDGQAFRIKLTTNQGNQVREDVITVIQREWREIGIETEVQVIAWSAFLEQFINKKNFQAVVLGWTTPVDPDPYAVWHTESINNSGLNFISYSNKEVDELIDAGLRTFDLEKRGEIYRRIHRLISEDAPYTFLFFPYATPAVDKRFKGIESSPAGIGHNFIDWRVPEDEVRYKF